MNAFRALLTAELRILLRDRMTFFFTLLFPLIFILIFGFLMGNIGNVDRASLGVAFLADVDRALLEETIAEAGALEIVPFDSLESLEGAVAKGSVDFGTAWDGEVLRLIYDPNRVQENYAFQQVADGITNDFDLKRQGLSPPVHVEPIHVGLVAATSWFNRVVPGILAFSVLSAGLFAVSGHLTAMKERRILDRMIVTPMPPVGLLAAIAVVRLILVYVSTLITLATSVLLFDLAFDVNWFHYTVFVGCATLGTMGLGTIIALVVRRPSSAGNLANVLAMVMMFLAGIYFPVELMPAFLRILSKGLPLTHMADAMRYATGVMEMSGGQFWTTALAFLGTACVLFPILARYVVRPARQ